MCTIEKQAKGHVQSSLPCALAVDFVKKSLMHIKANGFLYSLGLYSHRRKILNRCDIQNYLDRLYQLLEFM